MFFVAFVLRGKWGREKRETFGLKPFLLVNPFTKYLLNIYHVSGIVLFGQNTAL